MSIKSINIFDTSIAISSSIVSLGVTLDQSLSWDRHVSTVVGKSIGMLIRLGHLRHIMPLRTIVLLINALVLPHVRFCISVWGSCNATQRKRIGKIIKFARRIAGRESQRLAWHGDVGAEHNMAVLKIIRKSLLFPENTPNAISSLFKMKRSERMTRQCGNLDLAIPKTEYKKASLSYHGCKIWNGLPPHLRQCSIAEFSKYLKSKADAGELSG